MDWQLVTVALVVSAAVAYLVRRAYLAYKRPSCGDSCGTCPSKGSDKGPQSLVQIRLDKKRSPKDGDRSSG